MAKAEAFFKCVLFALEVLDDMSIFKIKRVLIIISRFNQPIHICGCHQFAEAVCTVRRLAPVVTEGWPLW